MKFSGLKLTGVFQVRSKFSPKSIHIARSSTRRTGTMQKSVLLGSSRRLSSLPKQKPASTSEIVEFSPLSSGYFSAEAPLEAKHLFQLLDRDGDGQISCYELETVLRRLGELPNHEEVSRMVNDADINGDGFISLDELEKLSSVPSTYSDARSNLIDAFNVFDADRDGKISVYELRRVFVALGDDQCTLEECLRMIRGVDMDGDGYVSFEEFVAMMTS